MSSKDTPSSDNRLRFLLIAGAALVIVIAAVVLGGSLGGDDEDGGGGGSTNALEGIPQEGFAIGEPDAPLTLVEYGDLQCPFCADAAREVLPALIDEYVAAGDLRIVFEPLTFIGPESISAAQMAAGAALQDLGFAFVEVFYENQGVENSGYVTDEFLTDLGDQVPGLDTEQALEERDSEEAQAFIDEAVAKAQEAGVDSTPSFFLGTTEENGELIEAAPDDVDAFREAIDAALEQPKQ